MQRSNLFTSFTSRRKTMITLINLTHTLLEINAAIDTGKYSSISLADIRDHIHQGDIFQYIKTTVGDDIDLSLIIGERSNEITAELQNVGNVLFGQERRKLGVENSGLCLLAGLIIELIQQRHWKEN